MPVLTLDCRQGNDRRIRATLRAELTAVVARIIGCPPEAVTVVIRDCEPGYRRVPAASHTPLPDGMPSWSNSAAARPR
ncbi:phenylpyruvate tautomerase PptA (4-oxalocrotonate tautomerase family) [Micromonospora sp. Llam0]|uniref:tautomerase family protein n=1 Tax=Micromonospora sp. Llam0 TaxID=2485143 RepID=UPI000F45F0DC|nr:tautomerase family protein [Micromonospora sp. Llam0]ROO60005.1 phenylpyruvate tautomerase PptA (4-oxalocrotonate tautomerase family) [Micromonospora sp. Llam0]